MKLASRTESRPANVDPDVAGLMSAGDIPRQVEPLTVARGAVAATPRVRSVSVVVPAKNESATVAALVAEIREALGTLDLDDFEVVVVDDGSEDATGELAARAGARVVRHLRSLGNGAAVKRGIRASRHDWILLMDADGQHPPATIPDLVREAEHYDMVVASRGGRGGSWYRNLANRCYNGLASYVTSRSIPDLTSGFRLVRADVLRRLVYLLPNTFSYPTTITLSMLRCGYDVGFVDFPVRPREGKSHIRLLKDGSRFLLIILKIATFFAPLRVFLPISAAVFGLGMAWYAYTFLTDGRFTNMAALLMSQAGVVFTLGLVSEQVAALRFEHVEEKVEG